LIGRRHQQSSVVSQITFDLHTNSASFVRPNKRRFLCLSPVAVCAVILYPEGISSVIFCTSLESASVSKPWSNFEWDAIKAEKKVCRSSLMNLQKNPVRGSAENQYEEEEA
jgi:hypothetical protein